jgi:metal-sulfur cluster biosynthetic enzyme
MPALDEAVRAALGTVYDPELDEPITDLGFVRSVVIAGGVVTVHLRLPTSFCAPNFAYLMAVDTKDALRAVPGVAEATVLLDDHHDSPLINAGLAADAGYKGTFGVEAEESLNALRLTFQRKAHIAAMERALTALVRAGRTEDRVHSVVLADLPDDRVKESLLRRRAALGFPVDDNASVLVDENGAPVPETEAVARLRRARSVRISIDGNAHFCRGLLQTRYPGSESDQTARPDDPGVRPLLPLVPVANEVVA